MRVPVTLSPRLRPQRAAKRVHVEQYGCATTAGEAETLRGVLTSRGHALVPSVADADTVILVTCTVVDRTERRMVKRLQELVASGREVVVSGCMASAQVDVIKHAAPDALVLPPSFVHQVGELIEDGVAEFCYQPKTNLPRVIDGAVAHVVINEGCSGKCTFCLTKIARPGLRSYPVDAIVADVQAAVDAGATEIRLTSQDTGAFGRDDPGEASLPKLLQAITSHVKGDYRLRVGMLNPWTFVDDVDAFIAAFRDPHVYRYLHIPVQSGSPRVLEAMHRFVAPGRVLEAVTAFRAALADLTVATDVICGFPGETDAEFDATVAFIDALEPDVVNVTRFSPRPGTPAAEPDRVGATVPGPVVLARSRRATEQRFRIGARRLAALVGRTVDVNVTETGTVPGTVRGRTDAYVQVAFRGDETLVGSRVAVRITAAAKADLRGELAA